MNYQQRARLLPELMKFASDPRLDAMTRSWIFDALRELTGESFGDDPTQWSAWYAARSGKNHQPSHQAVADASWLRH